ncbi:MAG: formate-dependent phosphoribosylglycinamide formyltransferase [Propionibacteriaceae bacterium]|nr:formate-dependent phosphoribosylglycinamide formyltransferase [Propionibacteriaceae bacterium]
MNIGTPDSPTATKVMLLGSGELGKEVIIALQRLGVETIAVDRYPNAPGQQVAHRAYTINMTDPEAVAEVIFKEKPDYVVPEIEAIATDALARVEERGWTNVIPCPKATQLTMNREGIRKLAAEDLGLPTSPYRFASSLDEVREAAEALGYPVVIKPVMSSSGHGQSVVREPGAVEAAWEYATTEGRVKGERVIVEGFVDFDYEITQLTVRAKGSDGEIHSHFCAPVGHRQQGGDYVESWQPQPMSEAALTKAREIADKVTTALGGSGIFGVELFVIGDEVYFSEVSPRPHDTGLVTMATQRLSEFELHARAILGLPVDTTLCRPGASAVIYGTEDSKAVVFEGLEEALAVPESDVRLFGKPSSSAPHRRMGVALATADDIETARERARECAQAVKVKY